MTDKNTGWQCPKCLVVYAPSVEKCECGVIPVLTKVQFKATNPLSGTTITTNSGFGTTSTGTAYICTLFTSNSPNGICSKCGQAEWKHHNVSYT